MTETNNGVNPDKITASAKRVVVIIFALAINIIVGAKTIIQGEPIPSWYYQSAIALIAGYTLWSASKDSEKIQHILQLLNINKTGEN
jgi:hypothetical protein